MGTFHVARGGVETLLIHFEWRLRTSVAIISVRFSCAKCSKSVYSAQPSIAEQIGTPPLPSTVRTLFSSQLYTLHWIWHCCLCFALCLTWHYTVLLVLWNSIICLKPFRLRLYFLQHIQTHRICLSLFYYAVTLRGPPYALSTAHTSHGF